MAGLTLQVELVSEGEKSSELKSLTLKAEPRTFLDIKKAIEKSFSIPVCVQSLLLHRSYRVSDSESPSQCYLRDGDTVQVTFPVKGECEQVVDVVEWLKILEGTILQMRRPHTYSLGHVRYKAFVTGVYAEMARDLSLNLLYPWSKETLVNKLHFSSLGGIRHIMSLYKFLVDARHSKIPIFSAHYMEMVCALFVANFTQTFPLRRKIIEHGGLDLCLSTFLCSPVDDKGEFKSSHAYDSIEVSLYAVCK